LTVTITQSTGRSRGSIAWLGIALVLGACGAFTGCIGSRESGPSASACPVNGQLTVSSGGSSRHALLHVPTSRARSTQFPVVLVLHGYGDTSELVQDQTGFSKKADQAGFVAVYPQALGDPAAWDIAGSRDTAFIDTLLTALEAGTCVDKTRVYATGMSLGGGMVNALGCRLSGRIAAIAPVSGLYGPQWEGSCTPSRPVPVVAFHGMLDTIVPYAGGPITDPDGNADADHPVIGVESWAAGWAARNHCDPDPQAQKAIGEVVPLVWQHCSAPVELYRIKNGGHSWPGNSWDDEPTNMDVVATDVIWQFFSTITLRAT
jgi:polyhydroxybutyrate depolymerase